MTLQTLFEDDSVTAADGPYVRLMKMRKWLVLTASLLVAVKYNWISLTDLSKTIGFIHIPRVAALGGFSVSILYLLAMFSASLYQYLLDQRSIIEQRFKSRDGRTLQQLDEAAAVQLKYNEENGFVDRWEDTDTSDEPAEGGEAASAAEDASDREDSSDADAEDDDDYELDEAEKLEELLGDLCVAARDKLLEDVKKHEFDLVRRVVLNDVINLWMNGKITRKQLEMFKYEVLSISAERIRRTMFRNNLRAFQVEVLIDAARIYPVPLVAMLALVDALR